MVSPQIGWGGMEWTDLAHDRSQLRALGKKVMNLRVKQDVGNFLSSWATGGFSRTQLHGVSQSVRWMDAFTMHTRSLSSYQNIKDVNIRKTLPFVLWTTLVFRTVTPCSLADGVHVNTPVCRWCQRHELGGANETCLWIRESDCDIEFMRHKEMKYCSFMWRNWHSAFIGRSLWW
jgi:hypothetical protein